MLMFMTASERDDRDKRVEELLSDMANGDRSAMGRLYELIRADIYAFALSKFRRKDPAEDITHDTFVKLWQYAPAYTPMGKPMAWILTIEHNLIRQFAARASKTVTLEEEHTEDMSENMAESFVQGEFIKELMSNLGQTEREIVILHVLSGLKHREIAKLLELPLSTVLSKYQRSIKKLQMIGKGGAL